MNEAALRALRENAVDLAAFDDRAGQPSRPFEDALLAIDKDVDAVKFAAESIGRDIRRKRTAAGFSQGELAGKAGVRSETISRLENGRGNPTVATIKKLLRVLTGASS